MLSASGRRLHWELVPAAISPFRRHPEQERALSLRWCVLVATASVFIAHLHR